MSKNNNNNNLKKEKKVELDSKITRFGYIINKKSLSELQINEIKKDLTAKPFRMGNFAKFAKDNSFPVYIENGDYISIPKYYGIERFGNPRVNRIENYDFPSYDMRYLGELRPKQRIIVDKVFKGFDEGRGGLLIAGCGSGKTNMAIYLACHYKLKTLFIVHKTFLKNQIINRIVSTTNIDKVGVIQQKQVEVNQPFVVAMVQSLVSRDYDDSIFKDFGMIIIDEVHHMGARNFSKVYQKISTKYMLGISAERQRNDGMYKIINWYMGPILHAEEQIPNDMVVVKKFHYSTSNEKRIEMIINKYTGEPDRSTMITNLVHIKYRNKFILKLIKELFDDGKNILILSGRLKQVDLMYKLLNKNKYTKGNVGKYIGSMNEESLAISATKQIILGTYEMAQEGLDIGHLNVVILCTPKSQIKQAIGRILRAEIYEEHPIVIDIVDDDNSVFKQQSNKRDAYYEKQHYNVQHFKVADYKKKKYMKYDDKKGIRKALAQVPKAKNKNNDKDGKKPYQSNYVPKVYKPMNCKEIDFSDEE